MEQSRGQEKENEVEQSVTEEATSKETLKDLEDNQKLSPDTSKSETEPSPDGAFDEEHETRDAGLM